MTTKGDGPVIIVRTPRRMLAAVMSVMMVVGVMSLNTPVGAVETGNHNGKIVSDKPVSWTPHVLDGYVGAFAEIGNKVVVGGNFQQIRTASNSTPITKPYIFVIEKNSGTITSFNADLNGEVTSLIPSGDGQTVFVGGGFSSVNGQTVRSLVKLNINTGQRVTQFDPPAFNGRVHDVALRNQKLFVSGRFTTVANQPHTLFAAVDATTGALDPSVKFDFAEPRRDGALSILASDVSPDGSKLVAIGNFTKVNGLPRYQIAQLNLTTSPPSVADWSTGQYGDGCSRSFQSYMRDVEYSPDGSFFVVGTTGAYSTTFLCDTAARWETAATGSSLSPTWTNYTGGDTLTSVAINDTAVYLGGHQRRANNPYAGDSVGAGAVDRQGLTAVDSRSGATLSWNPGRTRGYGVYGFLSTDSGLWIGSDTDRISNYTYKGRMAFMPLAGGKEMPAEYIGTLPGQTVSLQYVSNKDRVTTRNFSGTATTSADTSNSSTAWRNTRGAFMVDGVLYTGWSNKTLKRQSYDGSTFGPQTDVPLALIPDSSSSLNRFATEDLSTITGMFYDNVSGQLYFTRSSRNVLSHRSFSPESEIVGATRYDSSSGAAGVNWSNVRSMFIADGYLYTADSSGNLSRRVWNSATGLPSGSAQLVGGPAVDGQNWSAQDTFVYAAAGWQAPNTPPVAQASVVCNQATCVLDASASSDSDGTITSYAWDFGDGTTPGTGVTASHVYAASGNYTITLTVIDDRGASTSKQIQVAIDIPNVAPTAAFTTSCQGLGCTFDASGSADPDGSIASYSWNFGDNSTGTGVHLDHQYSQAGAYEVALTVTDNDGATNVRTTQIDVIDPNQTATVDFESVSSMDINWTEASLAIPTVSNNSTLLMFATVNNTDATITGPAGWTLVDSASDPTTSSQTFLWTRTASASDSGTAAVINASSVSKISTQILSYKGARNISAHAVEMDTVSHAERTTPSVSVATPGSRLVSYWADKTSATTGWTLPANVDLRAQTVGTGGGRIVSAVGDSGPLGTGPAGSLTATADSVSRRGTVWSVVLSPDTDAPNIAPVAAFTRSCSSLSCSFDASGSHDPDGSIVAYNWNFGDGQNSTGSQVSHSFANPGNYTVTLTVTDNEGVQSTTTNQVSVSVTTSIATFRAISHFNDNTIDANPPIPAAVEAGDTLVMIATVNNSAATITGPAGWTLLGGSSDPATDLQSFAWTKTATAGDAGATTSITSSAYSKISAHVMAYSASSGVSASAVSFDSVNHAERTTPSVNVANSGSALVSYWADKSSASNNWVLPAGTQLRSQSVGSGGGRITAAVADTGSLAPGLTGNLTATADSATRRAVTWSIVIAPA